MLAGHDLMYLKNLINSARFSCEYFERTKNVKSMLLKMSMCTIAAAEFDIGVCFYILNHPNYSILKTQALNVQRHNSITACSGQD